MAHFQDSQESSAVLGSVCCEERPVSVSPYGWVTKETCLLVKGFEIVSRSVVSDSATPWTVAHQTPLSMGFSRQEYYSGLPFPSPRDLPHPGTEPASLESPVLAGKVFTTALLRSPTIGEMRNPGQLGAVSWRGLFSALTDLCCLCSNLLFL